jgi:hypothetical protein
MLENAQIVLLAVSLLKEIKCAAREHAIEALEEEVETDLQVVQMLVRQFCLIRLPRRKTAQNVKDVWKHWLHIARNYGQKNYQHQQTTHHRNNFCLILQIEIIVSVSLIHMVTSTT